MAAATAREGRSGCAERVDSVTLPLYQDIVAKLKSLTRRVERLEAVEITSAGWVILPAASALTSTAWMAMRAAQPPRRSST
jgi:hypothetical protein